MARSSSKPSAAELAYAHRAGGSTATQQPAARPSSSSSNAATDRPPERRGFFGSLSTGQKALGGVAVGGLIALIVIGVTGRKAHAATLPPTSANSSGGGSSGGGSSGGGATSGTSEASLTPEQISHFKRILLGLGYTGLNADQAGTIGQYTRIALRAFQAVYNADNNAVATSGRTPNGRTELFSPRTLSVDGVLGPNTQQALGQYESFEAYR